MVTLMIKLVKVLIKGNRFELDSNVLPDKVNGLLPIWLMECYCVHIQSMYPLLEVNII